MVGELPDPARAAGSELSEGTEIFLVGPFSPSLAGSELAKLRGELDAGLPGSEIEPVAAGLALVRDLVRDGVAVAAHDISDGGSRLRDRGDGDRRGVGAELELDPLIELRGCSGETALFGEGPGGFLLAVSLGAGATLTERANAAGVDAIGLGRAGGDRIELSAAERDASVALADAERAWRSLPDRL